jgi:hypothetical protein
MDEPRLPIDDAKTVEVPTPMQVEVEAIYPNDLRTLYGAAIDQW